MSDILEKVQFDNGSIFEIFKPRGAKSEIQATTKVRYKYRALAGAMQPYVKSNIIWTSSEVFLNYKLVNSEYEDQVFFPIKLIGDHPRVTTKNNIPSYLSVIAIKYILSHISSLAYSKVIELVKVHIVFNGSYCFRCYEPLVANRKNRNRSEWDNMTCKNGHFIGLSMGMVNSLLLIREYKNS